MEFNCLKIGTECEKAFKYFYLNLFFVVVVVVKSTALIILT